MTTPSESLPTTRVAVIGVGSAGLAQLKLTRDAFARADAAKRTKLEIVGFETRDDVGGVWNYDKDVKPLLRNSSPNDPSGRVYLYPANGENPTPHYDDLRANLHKNVMQFRDYPFPEHVPGIAYGRQIHEYLRSYAEHFDLLPLVRFNTRVERLFLTPEFTGEGQGHRRWSLHSRGSDGQAREEEYDFVAVCNGHYYDPYTPSIPGLNHFPGEILHSRTFRRASEYLGKRVVVVGRSASGSDLTRLLALGNSESYHPSGALLEPEPRPKHAFTTLFQSATPGPIRGYNSGEDPWMAHVRKLNHIARVEPLGATPPPGHRGPRGQGTIVDVDGERVEVDVILFATGFYNSLPFAKKEDRPWSEVEVLDEVISHEDRKGGAEWEVGGVRGLHMGGIDDLLLFLKGDRTIAFPGLTFQIVPFPFSEAQSRLVSLYWAGLLPNFPAHPKPPPNIYNPILTPPPSPPVEAADANTTSRDATSAVPGGPLTPSGTPPPSSATEPESGRNSDATRDPNSVAQTQTQTQTDAPAVARRKTKAPPRGVNESRRLELTFPAPYEWVYTEYLFSLTREAEDREGGVERHWYEIEQFRRDLRVDPAAVRRRELGY